MPPGMTSSYRKPKNTGKTLGRILKYLWAYKVRLGIVVVAILTSSTAGVAGTYFLKPLINNCIVPYIGRRQVDWAVFRGTLLLMGGIYAVGVFASYLYNRLMVKITAGTIYRIRIDLFHHMQDLPVQYFDTHTHGEIMSRYTNDTDTLRQMLSMGLPQLIAAAVTAVGVFGAMVSLSPLLTVLVVAMLAVMLWVLTKVGGQSARFFKEQQQAVGAVNGYIEEIIEGQKVVKVFCHEDAVKKEFNRLNESLCTAATNANTFANILMPIMGNLSYIHYAITAAAGAALTIMGRLDLGTVASFLQYTRSFSQPITQVSQQLNAVLSALAGAERIFELIDEPPERDEGYVTLVNAVKDAAGHLTETDRYTGIWAWKHPHRDGSVSYTQLRGDVQFEDVTFGYTDAKKVLHHIALYAKPGQKIALVGPTGAGKTTMTNLINRFYELQEGKIRYDGINISKIKKDDLRRSLTMVLQDTHLFTGTVKDNIRYGNLDADDEAVITAAKLANAHSFIMHLPQGYDTVLTADGANLSQGQRQLLAIARAAVANPPVLILDEATSSIDTRTEALIEKGMDRLMAGRTVFVIAHRLSTVRNSNAIMVLQNGEITERGDHDALLKQRGKYYQLYTGMFELS
jgi:ATP-binding cassette subfamily B multidrug efflux pump